MKQRREFLALSGLAAGSAVVGLVSTTSGAQARLSPALQKATDALGQRLKTDRKAANEFVDAFGQSIKGQTQTPLRAFFAKQPEFKGTGVGEAGFPWKEFFECVTAVCGVLLLLL